MLQETLSLETLVEVKGINQSEVARDLGVSRNAVYLVVHRMGRAKRIETALAVRIGIDYDILFPARRKNRREKAA